MVASPRHDEEPLLVGTPSPPAKKRKTVSAEEVYAAYSKADAEIRRLRQVAARADARGTACKDARESERLAGAPFDHLFDDLTMRGVVFLGLQIMAQSEVDIAAMAFRYRVCGSKMTTYRGLFDLTQDILSSNSVDELHEKDAHLSQKIEQAFEIVEGYMTTADLIMLAREHKRMQASQGAAAARA